MGSKLRLQILSIRGLVFGVKAKAFIFRNAVL